MIHCCYIYLTPPPSMSSNPCLPPVTKFKSLTKQRTLEAETTRTTRIKKKCIVYKMDRKCCSSEKPCNFINVRENKDKLYTKYVTYSKSLFVFDIMANCRIFFSLFFVFLICVIYIKNVFHIIRLHICSITPPFVYSKENACNLWRKI